MTLLEKFAPSPLMFKKNMPLCCFCAPTTVIIHVMSLSRKKVRKDNALKKIAPQKSMLKKSCPPPTTIGREIFAPPPLVQPPPPPPPPHK